MRNAEEVEDIDTVEVRRARPEGTSPVVNFYTYGMVRNIGSLSKDGTHSLGKILIDGGSVMDIMPFCLAKRLELGLIPATDWLFARLQRMSLGLTGSVCSMSLSLE